jgi:hypothetical protein
MRAGRLARHGALRYIPPMDRQQLIETLKELRPDLAADLQPSILNLIGVEHIVGDNTGLVTHATPRDGLKEKFRARITSDIVEVF